jgi:hypothetical protein
MDKQKFGGYVFGFEPGCCTPDNPCWMDTRDSLEGDPICTTCGEEMEMSEVHEGYVCLNNHDEMQKQRGS